MLSDERSLAAWLARHGIDTASWGQAPAKSVGDLWREIQAGETTLQDNPPRRLVTVVQVLVRRGDLVLLELEQELRGGQIRRRHRPPSEKLKPNEDVLPAALRCLLEEVGLPAEQVERLRVAAAPAVTETDSPSYPGLMTRYRLVTVETEAAGLPESDFWRDNRLAGASDPVVRHRWGWRPGQS